MNLNRVDIIGRIGVDIEERKAGQHTLAILTVATTFKTKQQESTEWHNIEVWGNSAEYLLKYAKKGDLIFVSGRLQTDKWEKDGVHKQKTKIIANNCSIVSQSSNNNQTPTQKLTPDDIPF